MTQRYLVIGGAGFIGSHIVDALLADPTTSGVTVYDNFSSGTRSRIEHHGSEQRLTVVAADVHQHEVLAAAMTDCDCVIHLASNPDIARAMTDPSIDFVEGTELTHCIVEAARLCGVKTIVYSSGSGVYGDLGETVVSEDHGPLVPVSTYGASKLAGEALICAYAHLFAIRGVVLRFGNVVGPRQTHGVGYDFVRRLQEDSTSLAILGDGRQSKPYVHISDVVAAIRCVLTADTGLHSVFNVAPSDQLTVAEIADLAIAAMGAQDTVKRFGDSPRGWAGDVPLVRLDTSRIRSLGWLPQRTSRQAMQEALAALVDEVRDAHGSEQSSP